MKSIENSLEKLRKGVNYKMLNGCFNFINITHHCHVLSLEKLSWAIRIASWVCFKWVRVILVRFKEAKVAKFSHYSVYYMVAGSKRSREEKRENFHKAENEWTFLYFLRKKCNHQQLDIYKNIFCVHTIVKKNIYKITYR